MSAVTIEAWPGRLPVVMVRSSVGRAAVSSFCAVETEVVARVRGISVNSLIIDVLEREIARVRNDKHFATKAKQLLKRDRELLERLAR